MDFESFYKKYRKNYSREVYQFSKEGLKYISNTSDPLHDTSHIEDIFSHLDKLLQSEKNLNVDIDILVLAVAWHDVWKAGKTIDTFIEIVVGQMIEGIFSAQIFRKHTRKYKLPKYVIDGVSYAIRKHSQIQFIPTTTVESKLLNDADSLESFNIARLQKNNGALFKSPILPRLFYLYFKYKPFSFNFNLTNEIFREKRKNMLEFLEKKLSGI